MKSRLTCYHRAISSSHAISFPLALPCPKTKTSSVDDATLITSPGHHPNRYTISYTSKSGVTNTCARIALDTGVLPPQTGDENLAAGGLYQSLLS